MKKFKRGELTALLKGQTKVMIKLAQDAIDRIQLDASVGIFQNDSGLIGQFPYKSRQYAKYKGNGMRSASGGKLKPYIGIATNTQNVYVDMKLTGKTLRGMTPGGRPTVALIKYPSASTGLILGNKDRGYDIYALREENKNFIVKRYGEDIIDANLRKYISKPSKL